eukprot:SAG22_NODE_223_length_14745_cov_16.175065_6_plen_349_part_00
MSAEYAFPVGRKGEKWAGEDVPKWLALERSYGVVGAVKREYKDEVISKIESLGAAGSVEVETYGELSYTPGRYPLFAAKTKGWDASKPYVLVTGGVHGYETSGVQGALLFLETAAAKYAATFNILVLPCISPWGYETINRWNKIAVDPNRSFVENSPAEESGAAMAFIAGLGVESWVAHIDLHETTDTDESEFRPAKSARDGEAYIEDSIPDGFYLVGDTDNPQHAWHTAIIDEVRKVTHIAPPDASGNIIGEKITQEGVITYPTKSLGLCSSTRDGQVRDDHRSLPGLTEGQRRDLQQGAGGGRQGGAGSHHGGGGACRRAGGTLMLACLRAGARRPTDRPTDRPRP